MTERIGIFGGTFDPIHIGHIQIALEAKNIGKMDKVLLVVAKDPVHKRCEASASDRFLMVSQAVQKLDGIEACNIELMMQGKVYAVDTVLAIRKMYPLSELFYIVGNDEEKSIRYWHRAEELLSMVTVLSFPRAERIGTSGVVLPSERKCESKGIRMISACISDVSSTEIRRKVNLGEPITGIVSHEVEKYIYQHHLYTENR